MQQRSREGSIKRTGRLRAFLVALLLSVPLVGAVSVGTATASPPRCPIWANAPK